MIHYCVVHHLAVPSGWDRPRGAATSPTVGSGHGLVPASWPSCPAAGEFPRNNGEVIGKSWEIMENIWKNHGKHTENIWKTYGKHGKSEGNGALNGRISEVFIVGMVGFSWNILEAEWTGQDLESPFIHFSHWKSLAACKSVISQSSKSSIVESCWI